MRTARAFSIAALMTAGAVAYGQNAPPDRPPTTPPPSPPRSTPPAAKPVTPPTTPPKTTAQEMKKGLQLERASKIIGTNVKNNAGESLGEINDLALDVNRGRVGYVVLSFGGILNVGDKLFAVPFESFEFNRLNKVAVLNVEKERLKNAPGFDKNKWPDFASETWGTEVHKYYGVEPYWIGISVTTTARPVTIAKASDVVGMDAHNNKDEDLGEIEDVVIELNHGHIAYAVLASGGVLGLGEKLFALPWEMITLKTGENVIGMDKQLAVLTIEKDRLKDAPGFAKDRWPDLADARWMREVNTYYGTEPDWVYGTTPIEGEGTTTGMAGWDKPDYYGKYSATSVTTIKGKIADVQHFKPMATMGEGVLLVVLDDAGKTMRIHLGPMGFVQKQTLKLQKDQQVTIIGSKVTFDGQEVIMAKDVTVGTQTIRLRDDTGRPLWLSGAPTTPPPRTGMPNTPPTTPPPKEPRSPGGNP